MADLQQKLAEIQGLLPSQAQWLERLVFQLEYNQFQLIRAFAGPGSGKTTLSLAVADLLSDQFNLAMLTVSAELTEGQIRHHILDQWFGFGVDSKHSLASLIGDRQSPLPLALIIDQADQLSDTLWNELTELACLVIAFGEQADAHADLNLPLNSLTLEDSKCLLQDQGLSTLSLADRLEQANGNIYLLQDPQLARKQRRVQSAQPANSWQPLMVFISGLVAIASVVVFWLWTEKQRAEPGLGQLTYLPEEQSVAPAPLKEAPPPAPASRQVVNDLVDKLETAKPSTGKVAALERPVNFADEQVSVSAPAVTESSVAQKPEPEVISQSVATAPPTNNEKQQTAVSSPTTEAVTTPANSREALVDPLATPKTSALSETTSDTSTTALPAETTLEDEITAELASTTVKPEPVKAVASEAVQEDQATQAAKELQQLAASDLGIDQEPTSTKAATAYPFDEATLLAMNNRQVALQLVVFSHEAALRSFQKTYKQLSTLVYTRTKNNQKQYVVVMAPFDSPAAAKAQISQLPSALQQGFVKSVADIQAEIQP